VAAIGEVGFSLLAQIEILGGNKRGREKESLRKHPGS